MSKPKKSILVTIDSQNINSKIISSLSMKKDSGWVFFSNGLENTSTIIGGFSKEGRYEYAGNNTELYRKPYYINKQEKEGRIISYNVEETRDKMLFEFKNTISGEEIEGDTLLFIAIAKGLELEKKVRDAGSEGLELDINAAKFLDSFLKYNSAVILNERPKEVVKTTNTEAMTTGVNKQNTL